MSKEELFSTINDIGENLIKSNVRTLKFIMRLPKGKYESIKTGDKLVQSLWDDYFESGLKVFEFLNALKLIHRIDLYNKLYGVLKCVRNANTKEVEHDEDEFNSKQPTEHEEKNRSLVDYSDSDSENI